MQEEIYEIFENYLNDEMASEEKITFENQLQNDTKLRAQFELYKETTQFLEVKFSNETLDFKENLKTISNHHFSENTSKKPKVISMQSKWFAIAAVFVVFIGIWFLNSGNPSYADYNQHENANFVERGSVIKDLKQAQEAFNNKKYEQAIPLFQKVLTEYKRPEIELYYGISLLEVNKTSEAATVFNELKNGKSVYKEDAIWYLALVYLKQEKYEECKSYLKKITKDSEKYSKAQRLLNDLD